jgi:ribonuclease P protein component
VKVRFRSLTQFSRSEITDLFKNGKVVVRAGDFLLRASASTLSYGRILLVIPKRAIASAPLRNKVRRRLKSYFYEQRLYERKKDFVLIVKKSDFLQRPVASVFKMEE